MDTRKSRTQRLHAGHVRAAARPQAGGAFRIRYGRTAIALAGLALSLTAVFRASCGSFGTRYCLAAAGVASWPALPPSCCAPARRPGPPEEDERRLPRRHGFARRASARRSGLRCRIAPLKPPYQRKVPFSTPRPHSLRPKPLTAVELREAALAVALAAGDNSARQSAAGAAGMVPETSWEPVEVPKPTYVEAAKADRPLPSPSICLRLPRPWQAVAKQGPAAAPAPRRAGRVAPDQGSERPEQPRRRPAASPRLARLPINNDHASVLQVAPAR